MNISQSEKDKFFNLVDSLKKCRRADLSDIGNDKDVIEKLYVDPLENDLVLKSVLKPNTTIMSGRRGTGKSTIIARLQHEIRKTNDRLSLYIDVKTIFEQSRNFTYQVEQYSTHFKPEELKQYLVYKSFLREIVAEIKKELKTNTLKFFMAKITKHFGPDKTAYEEELNRIFDEIEEFEYLDVEILKGKKITSNQESSYSQQTQFQGKVDASLAGINASTSASYNSSESGKAGMNQEFSDALLKSFNPIQIMRSIRDLLQKIGIKNVFLCLDDFSEIELEAMKVFVDVIIAPLNNLSEEYFKFKIAAYPGRIYLGDIDPQKIEQIKLDFYELYQAKTITIVQAQAQRSIKNLIEKRIKYFCKNDVEYFFDTSKTDIEEYYKRLFDITSSVPRNVGWVLWYANQQSISKDKRITLGDLSIAAEKHFIDTIQPYFSKNKFMREPFEMKLEKFHLNQLLLIFVASAKANKREILISDSKVFSKDKTNPPTSHFYINKKLEEILQPLEMQFFITKYNEQKDQDSNELMSFFSLNYGLCQSEDINYGRGSDRKYVIQRRFNCTRSLQSYLSSAKHIVCNNSACQASYEYEKLSNLEMFDMLCPKCMKGTCSVEHANVDIDDVSEEILLPEFDVLFLNSLKIDSPQYPSELALELDCTYQKVGKKAAKLKEKGLLNSEKKMLDIALGERNYYSLSSDALEIYFKTKN
ncbi:MAG: hypothetical protein K8R74_17630 [Bacteroidales bacterium]|nr:hypothetical protein [Bacteroidales bacterium]